MSADCRTSIPDRTRMVRGVRASWVNRLNGRIRKDAFIPRRNGKDDDGLSISQPAQDSREALRQRLSNEEGVFCSFVAGSAREIAEEDVTLDVCPDPTERDPYHSLIKGVPTDRNRKLVATRLAQRLADISAIYEPPE